MISGTRIIDAGFLPNVDRFDTRRPVIFPGDLGRPHDLNILVAFNSALPARVMGRAPSSSRGLIMCNWRTGA
jgi:hypothetical protein